MGAGGGGVGDRFGGPPLALLLGSASTRPGLGPSAGATGELGAWSVARMFPGHFEQFGGPAAGSAGDVAGPAGDIRLDGTCRGARSGMSETAGGGLERSPDGDPGGWLGPPRILPAPDPGPGLGEGAAGMEGG